MIHKRIPYRQHQRRRAIARRRRISKQCGYGEWYSVAGKYDKGKIHCSCWMCSGKRWAHGWSVSDIRKRDKLDNCE